MPITTRSNFINGCYLIRAGLVATNSFPRILATLTAGSGIKSGYASITLHEDYYQFLKVVLRPAINRYSSANIYYSNMENIQLVTEYHEPINGTDTP